MALSRQSTISLLPSDQPASVEDEARVNPVRWLQGAVEDTMLLLHKVHMVHHHQGGATMQEDNRVAMPVVVGMVVLPAFERHAIRAG